MATETNTTLRERLSTLACTSLPNAALISPGDGLSVGDVREILRLLADRDGWVRAAESQNRQWAAKCMEATELRARIERLESAVAAVVKVSGDWRACARLRAALAEGASHGG